MLLGEAFMANSVSFIAIFSGLTGVSHETFRNDSSFLDAQKEKDKLT